MDQCDELCDREDRIQQEVRIEQLTEAPVDEGQEND